MIILVPEIIEVKTLLREFPGVQEKFMKMLIIWNAFLSIYNYHN